MILDPPRILKLGIRLLEPLTRLDSILARTHKRDNSLCIVTPCIVNRLQKDIIQAIDLSTMLSRSARNLVNRFKSHHLAFARQLGANLEPQLAEPLLERSHIGASRSKVGPGPASMLTTFCTEVGSVLPRVMVHVDNGVHAARGDHVDNV